MSALPMWVDALLAVLVIVGTAFALVGSYGLLKLSDLMKRLHGPTKSTTLGVGAVLIASSVYFSFTGTLSMHEFLITLFLFITAPVSAHLLIQAIIHLSPEQGPGKPPGRDTPTDRVS